MTISGVEPVARLVLDTSAYSHLRHGHSAVLDHVASAGTVLLPLIVLGELEAGYELGTRHRENRLMLEEFLDEPFVALLPLTRSVARRYGRLFAQLRRGGTPIPINDVWIAGLHHPRGRDLRLIREEATSYQGPAPGVK
jgi:tRNA(fMet)-specific endonuclease VapC